MFVRDCMADADIDAIVSDMDRADTALAMHIRRVRVPDDAIRDLLETRAAILRWCADSKVAGSINAECVRATATAVHSMTLPEFSDYVRALEHLARVTDTQARGVA